MLHQPAEGSLNDPAARQHAEALFRRTTGDHLDIDAVLGAVSPERSLVSAIDPHLADRRMLDCYDIKQVFAGGSVRH